MREIKFRARRLEINEWVFGAYLQEGEEIIVATPNPDKESDELEIEFYTVDPATVGQYTGLKDKNGKEIYEGDILRRYENVVDNFRNDMSKDYTLDDIFQVKYVTDHIGAHFLACNRPTEYYKDHDYTTWIDVEHMEVIGNIYENKELLTEKQK